MRTIPIFLISLGLLAGCTLYPKKGGPDDTPPPEPPVLACTEACTSDAQCWEGTVCNKGRCAECKTDAQCGDGRCFEGTCFACTEDAHCTNSPLGKLCSFDAMAPDPATTTCGECLADSDCSTAKGGTRCAAPGTPNQFQCSCYNDSQCDAAAGLGLCRLEGCVCSKDSACTTGAKKCDLGECVACSEDAHCTDPDGDPATPFKSKCFAGGAAGAYCGCAADDECASGLCDTMSGSCVECKTAADCDGNPAGEVCIGGACGACQEDKDCTDSKRGSVCADGACTCSAASECKPNITGTTLKWTCE